MNIDDFIGMPFRHGGRGPDAFDCYGLVAAVLKAARKIEVPDWHADSASPQAAARAITAALSGEVAGGRTRLVEHPADYDIAIVGGSHAAHHVGIYVSGGVLHVSEALGSVWHQLSRFRMIYPRTEFYRWQP